MTTSGSKQGAQRDLVRRVGMSGNYWYAVEQEKNLKQGRVIEVTFWKTSIALYRGQDGIVHALENRCAHRHVRLSKGQVEGNTLTCAYHGWTYDGCGTCVRISHELGKSRSKMPDIRIRAYPVRCKYGLIWLFPGNPALAGVVPLPSFPVLDGPRPWPFVPIDMTIKAHFSMVVENVCDFNHAYLHRKYKPFWNPHARAMWREADTIYIDYDTNLGQGQAARLGTEHGGKHLNRIRVWYQYPYQGSDLQGKYFHWLYMLPIDEQTTRCFFYFVFGPMEIPYIRLNIPFVMRKPLLHLFNRMYLKPLLGQDKWVLEEEQQAHQFHAGKPSYEFNPLVRPFQKLTIEKWAEYMGSERARMAAASSARERRSTPGAGLTQADIEAETLDEGEGLSEGTS